MAVPPTMLRVLRIRNLAVIQEADVDFAPGLNVLTGETGAGKSILVEAVGLLLGARTSADLVRTGEAAASIEAVFDGPDGDPVVVRREITSQGRSRSYINGTAATAAALRDLSQQLVALHGQHAHQALLDPLTHLPLLDEAAQLQPLAAQVAERWGAVRARREQVDRSRMDAREKAARLDLIAFQLGEIDAAAPKPGEDEELAALRQVLANADRLQRLCEESYAVLYEQDEAVLTGLGGVWKRIGELAALDTRFVPYVEARDGIKAQLEDLAFFLRRYSDDLEASPQRLQQVEDRLALLDRLKRKYGPSLQEVIDRGAALARERRLLTGDEGEAGDLGRALEAANAAYLDAARRLSHERRRAALPFAQRLEALLADLAMDRARFEVRFLDREPHEDVWTERGIDQAEFFLSPNPGEELRPLARIVSGGELSRVMLALTTPVAAGRHAEAGRPRQAPSTLVFDEVDAGIGGRVADVVGARLRQLGDHAQVLCITHLPQIAARAATQFRIEKAVQGSRTITTVRRLSESDRIDEIARMMAGGRVTDAVRQSARDLLAGGAGQAAPAPASSGPAPRRR